MSDNWQILSDKDRQMIYGHHPVTQEQIDAVIMEHYFNDAYFVKLHNGSHDNSDACLLCQTRLRVVEKKHQDLLELEADKSEDVEFINQQIAYRKKELDNLNNGKPLHGETKLI